MVKNGFTRMAQYANTATTIGSTLLGSFAGFGAKKAAQSTTPSAPAHGGWGRWAGPAAYAVGGALIAGAAAGGAYYKKDELTQGFSWATDHMKYVGNLWDDAALEERINALVDIERDHGVVFRKLVRTYLLHLTLTSLFVAFILFCLQIRQNFLRRGRSWCFQNTGAVQRIISYRQVMPSLQMKSTVIQECLVQVLMMGIIDSVLPVQT